MTDPIADMLTRIRNAIAAKHSRVDIPASKLKLEIARILKEEGYINNFVIKGEGLKRTVRIFLRYDARGTSSITHLQRVSTPGRVYMGSSKVPKVVGGYGINIVGGSRRSPINRAENDPDLLYPTSPSKIGKEKIEAVVGMNVLKLKASLENGPLTDAFAEEAI
jgi:small subunit ribosomal protein S8